MTIEPKIIICIDCHANANGTPSVKSARNDNIIFKF